jgi:hypothetical protein
MQSVRLTFILSAVLAFGCSDGKDGTSCTVTHAADGSVTIECTDGTSATIPSPTDGTDGSNGADGHDALILTSAAGAGACPTGGTQVDVGVDDGSGTGGVADDGVLQAGEIDATYVICSGQDGVDGTDGTDGTDGHDALVDVNDATTAQCPYGGKVITAGVDDGSGGGIAGDGVLQSSEIDDTAVVCDGSSCTVTNHGNGTSTMSCEDGTSTTWWSGVFPTIDTGARHGCGVRATDATLRCWGYNPDNRATPPAGTFSSVATGGTSSCGIRSDGTLACWGAASPNLNSPPTGTFHLVDVGGWDFGGTTFACAIKKSDRSLACWGAAPSQPMPTGMFLDVGAGYVNACALRTDHTLSCWGPLSSWTATPTGTFKSLSMGFNHACAIRSDDTVSCWGFNGGGGLGTFPEKYLSVAAGYDFSCGVKDSGDIACWGLNNGNVISQRPTTGVYVAVSAGDSFACAVREDGEVICWGSNADNRATPPADQFP